MTLADIENSLARHGLVCQKKSFRELSESRTDPSKPVRYCVNVGGRCEKIEAINFDPVVNDFYACVPFAAKSTDALYIWQDEVYLIEFKTGEVDTDAMYRKLYDSCIMLVEAGVLTWNDCLLRVTGMLVQENAAHRFSAYDLPGTARPASDPPYEYALPLDLSCMNSDTDYRILSDYLVKKVYVLTPNDFDAFGLQRGWQ